MPLPTAADVLATVDRSAQLVGSHDRSAWIDLFTAQGRVADPVGSSPHIGHAQIGRFYDTFIGPRDIVFERDRDFVTGMTVIRDLTLRIRMDSTMQLAVPAVLRYVVAECGDDLKIAELNAYWELPPMMVSFAGHGFSALPTGLALARGLLVNQGLRGTAGFLRGLRRPGRRARATVDELLSALATGDELGVARMLARRAPVDDTPAELVARLRDIRWSKVIAAGESVVVSVRHPQRGVLIVDFADRDRISRLRVFGC